jgi:hypothetical protein
MLNIVVRLNIGVNVSESVWAVERERNGEIDLEGE